MRINKGLLMLAVMNLSFAEGDWYTRKLEGWYYFQGSDSLEVEAPCFSEDALAILEEEKLKLQEALSLALLAPTPENINSYIVESQRQLDRSAQFADAWGKALSGTPELADFPNIIRQLAKTHFLLFCFRGQDPLSREAAETANIFSQKYGWTLKAVSLDGARADGLEAFEHDQGMAKTLGIRSTTSFYAVDPARNKVTLVGTNSATVSDLEHNIESQLGASDE